jgi:L-iditol 2-dehydrogenase
LLGRFWIVPTELELILRVEAVGKSETVNAAIDSVRKGGSAILVGNVSPDVTLPLQKVVTRQIRLQGSCASAGEYPRAIELMSSPDKFA